MVEGVHFRLGDGWATPAEVGHRALAGALSDLAAVGAAPGEAFLSLGLRPRLLRARRARARARRRRARAQHRNRDRRRATSSPAPALFVSVAVTGWLGEGERPLAREGAQPGDLVGVTGQLGAAAAALAVMDGTGAAGARGRAGGRARAAAAPAAGRGTGARARRRERRDRRLGRPRGRRRPRSAVRQRRRARCSQADLLPLAPGVAAVAERLGLSAAALGAAGGEDYELCFCAPSAAPRADRAAALAAAGGAGVSWIGEVREGLPGARLLDGRGDVVRAEGYEHRW